MTNGSIEELLHKKSSLEVPSFRRRMIFAQHTAQGLNWLHRQNLLHLNLKPANVTFLLLCFTLKKMYFAKKVIS